MDVGRLDVEQALGTGGCHTASLFSQECHYGTGGKEGVSAEEDDATGQRNSLGKPSYKRRSLPFLLFLSLG